MQFWWLHPGSDEGKKNLLCHFIEVLSVLFGVLRPRLELEATDHVEDGVLGEHHLEQRVLEQPVNHQESQKAHENRGENISFHAHSTICFHLSYLLKK